MANKKKSGSQQRHIRVQQAIFAIIALMIIMVMILSLVAK
jgi:hypothetical protein